ncbi:hypothetical protein I79_015527 [Cricetulus griseus]|uniref:Uncharacterized protein n=1 Tax=Cricetulus griseus TaxID=10029 RepID=G3HX12_CRIGR|nr:hypothetical protein I79_015527 [Cricetulus griseus]
MGTGPKSNFAHRWQSRFSRDKPSSGASGYPLLKATEFHQVAWDGADTRLQGSGHPRPPYSKVVARPTS